MEYTTSTYAWKIISVDTSTNHMVVEYSIDPVVDNPTDQSSTDLIAANSIVSTASKLNLSIPAKGEDIAVYIDKFAPKQRWEQRDSTATDHVSVGTAGVSILTASVQPNQTEATQLIGSFQEEYIRALIYQVMEEIKTESL